MYFNIKNTSKFHVSVSLLLMYKSQKRYCRRLTWKIENILLKFSTCLFVWLFLRIIDFFVFDEHLIFPLPQLDLHNRQREKHNCTIASHWTWNKLELLIMPETDSRINKNWNDLFRVRKQSTSHLFFSLFYAASASSSPSVLLWWELFPFKHIRLYFVQTYRSYHVQHILIFFSFFSSFRIDAQQSILIFKLFCCCLLCVIAMV